MFTAMVPTLTPISRDHNKKLVKIIQNLLTYEESNIFRKPIPHKALGWDDYKEFVKKPVDLNFVRRQYNEGKYKFVEEVLDQIQLVFQNAFVYGKREHQSFDLAIKMQKHFDQLLNDFLPEYYAKINRVLYLKQFEQTKPDKKNTVSFSQQKNNKKVEKMDVETIKEQIKVEMVPQTILPKKNSNSNSRRAQSATHLPNSTQSLIQQNRQVPKKNGEMVPINEEVKKKNFHTSNPPIIIPTEEKKQPIVELKVLTQKNKQSLISTKQGLKEQKNTQNIHEPIIQENPAQSQQKYHLNKVLNEPQAIPQQQNLKPQVREVPEPIENEESQDNPFPPIMVTLNKTPSPSQIQDLTNMMNLLFEIQEFETLSKVVRILTKYEKENMVIDGENVSFKMDQIHISTYTRICKDLEIKFYQLQHRQKVKDFESLLIKHNIKSFLMNLNPNQNLNGIHQDSEDNFANKGEVDEQQHILLSNQ